MFLLNFIFVEGDNKGNKLEEKINTG